jgi:hypothetical protein
VRPIFRISFFLLTQRNCSRCANQGYPHIYWNIYDQQTSHSAHDIASFRSASTSSTNCGAVNSRECPMVKYGPGSRLRRWIRHLYWCGDSGCDEHEPSGDEGRFAGFGNQQVGQGMSTRCRKESCFDDFLDSLCCYVCAITSSRRPERVSRAVVRLRVSFPHPLLLYHSYQSTSQP